MIRYSLQPRNIFFIFPEQYFNRFFFILELVYFMKLLYDASCLGKTSLDVLNNITTSCNYLY